MSDYNGLPTAFLENEHLRLEYLTAGGPRLVGLFHRDSDNLLADVHDLFWTTSRGDYYPLGGHRLWISPEVPELTYIPDGNGLEVRQIPDGLVLTGLVEPGSGVQKSLRIQLEGRRPAVRLLHTITNRHTKPIRLAPWAITMFKLGGTVILPQPVGDVDPDGKLNNRILTFWPYTRINDPRLHLADDFITLGAQADLPPCKMGYCNPHGWIAYWVDGLLFVKRYDPCPEQTFPDSGSNTETYCGDRFVELETLGPLQDLAPGQSLTHNETWELYEGLDQPFIPEALRERLKS
jgi:hypothetical protein